MAGRVAGVTLGLLAALALIEPWLPLADPLATAVRFALQPPSAMHPFGTDALGRDVLARVLAAARLDLGLALVAVALAASLGSLVGALAGWFGGMGDRLSGWLVDVLLALPLYVLAMVLAGAIGNSLAVVVLATAVINLPFYIRLVRVEVQRVARAPFVDAARMAGQADGAILGRLVLPVVAPLIAIQATTNLGWAMLNTAGLSFIGVGVRPPTPEWGVMIAEGARYLSAGHWWLVAFPALALALAVTGFQAGGEALRARIRAAGA